MNIGKGILAAFFIMLASAAMAQIDPDPDGIGIYFDQGATVNSVVVADGTESVTAYLILTNPTIDGDMNNWTGFVSTYLNDANQGTTIFGRPNNGHNLIVSNMPGSFHWSFQVSVYSDPPLPATPITILAELEILMYNFEDPIYLYVHEGAGYSAGAGGAAMNPASGSWDLPLAVINGEAPVAVESKPWGGVKLLYR